MTSFSSSSFGSSVVGRRGERSRFGGVWERRKEGVRDAFFVMGAGHGARRPTPLPRTSISSSDEEKRGRSFKCFPLAGGTAFRSIGQDAAGTPTAFPPVGFPSGSCFVNPQTESSVSGPVDGAPGERLTGDGLRIHLACYG